MSSGAGTIAVVSFGLTKARVDTAAILSQDKLTQILYKVQAKEQPP